MVSLFQAQTGNRAYGFGVRQAPNKGPVSAKGAQGYMARELRNRQQNMRPAPMNNSGFTGNRSVATPYGSDGKSDRRSGLAAKVLNGGFGGKTDAAIQKHKDQLQQLAVKNANPKPNGTNAIQGNAPQAVTANANGVLELPYNQDFAEGQYAALDQANQALLGFKNEADNQAIKYNQQLRQEAQQYDQTKLQTLNGNAANGTAYSSMYGTAVANNAQQHANAAGMIDQENTAFQQDLAARRAASQSAYAQANQKATQEYGDALGEQAGTLGYGQTKTRVANNDGKKKTSGSSHTKAAQKSLSGKSSTKKSSTKKIPTHHSKPRSSVPNNRTAAAKKVLARKKAGK